MKAALKESLKEAMKAREKTRVDTIRSLLAAIQYDEMQKEVEDLTKEESIAALRRELKKRVEGIEFAKQAERSEELAQLTSEIAVIEGFLPSQLTEEQLESIISELQVKDPSINMGLAMKALKDSYAGQYDGKIASSVAKRMLG